MFEAVLMMGGLGLVVGAGQAVEHPFPGLLLLIDFVGLLQQEGGRIAVMYRAATRLKGKGGSLTALETTDLDTGEKMNLPCGTLVIPSGRIPEMIVVRAEADQPEAADTAIAWEAFEPYKKPDFHKEIGLIPDFLFLSFCVILIHIPVSIGFKENVLAIEEGMVIRVGGRDCLGENPAGERMRILSRPAFLCLSGRRWTGNGG